MIKEKIIANPLVKQIPNILTIYRLIIAFVIMFIPPYETAFYVVYALCGISDLFDGVLARALHSESKIGATLDSIGDTLLTWTTCHVVYSNMDRIYWGLIAILLGVYATRIIATLITLCRFRKFAMLHTVANKVAMIILYLYPFFYSLTFNAGCMQEVIYAICALGILAGLEEIIIQCIVPELDEHILSIVQVFKRKKAGAADTGDALSPEAKEPETADEND